MFFAVDPFFDQLLSAADNLGDLEDDPVELHQPVLEKMVKLGIATGVTHDLENNSVFKLGLLVFLIGQGGNILDR